MGFTFSQEASPGNVSNSYDLAELDIVVSPTTPIISAVNFIGGQNATGIIDVSNNSDVDFLYFVSADWRESPGTSISLATILANRLTVSVATSPGDEALFAGRLVDLIDQPSGGRPLGTADPVESLNFTLSLSEANASNLIQGAAVLTDFVFVATQSPA